jgi:hypothetical protein
MRTISTQKKILLLSFQTTFTDIGNVIFIKLRGIGDIDEIIMKPKIYCNKHINPIQIHNAPNISNCRSLSNIKINDAPMTIKNIENIISIGITSNICDSGITISIIMGTIPEKTLVLHMLYTYVQYPDAHKRINFLRGICSEPSAL